MVCHGSSCQDFSVAGKGLGGDKGSGTRSSLMWETVRIVEKLKPKYVIWENVKNLLSKKHRHNFDAYIETLDNLGYNSYYQVLNAKEYGIPQNRERVFTVSIRKDVDDGKFEFPETIPLEKKLKDVLEKEVDEKYYLPEERVASIKFSGKIDSNVVGKCEAINGHDILKRIYNTETVAPTLHTMGGGNTEPKIIDPQGRKNKVNTPKEVAPTLRAQDHGNPPMAIVDDTYANRDARVYESSAPTLRSERSGLKVVVEPFIVASRGRNPDNPSDRTTGAPTEQRLEAHTDGVSNTLTSVLKDAMVAEPIGWYLKPNTRIGRLTLLADTGKKQGTNHIWKCQCDCGNLCEVSTGHLRSGGTRSCGCLRIESHRTHGETNTRLHNIWTCIKQRINNPKNPSYERYGGRGIKLCPEWEQYENFREWALSNGYKEDLTIDRIDNDKDYCPSNCRWTTKTEQVNNRGVWGEIPYHGIVRDNTGYGAQVTVGGKKIYIAHSKDNIRELVEKRNTYIDEHHLPDKKNVWQDNYVGQFLPIKNATKKGYLEGRPHDGVYTQTGNKRGTVQPETAQTLTTREDKGVVLPGLRVRKLTPLECWRLQGYDDEDFYKAQNAGISNCQLYKMAGNGICRACPIAIFSQLLCERKWNDMTDEERQALVKPSQVDKKA